MFPPFSDLGNGLLAAQYEICMTLLSVLPSVPLVILGAVLITMAGPLDDNIYIQIGMILLIRLSSKSVSHERLILLTTMMSRLMETVS